MKQRNPKWVWCHFHLKSPSELTCVTWKTVRQLLLCPSHYNSVCHPHCRQPFTQRTDLHPTLLCKALKGIPSSVCPVLCASLLQPSWFRWADANLLCHCCPNVLPGKALSCCSDFSCFLPLSQLGYAVGTWGLLVLHVWCSEVVCWPF